MQDVCLSPVFHQWMYLIFLYMIVCSETRLENFDFWVWIKHPLFQEQALIPVVRRFKQSNTHKFTWFDNLLTPRSYWFVLITQRNNTNKEEEKTLLNSTLLTQALSILLLSFSLFSLYSTTHFSSSMCLIIDKQGARNHGHHELLLCASGMSCFHHVLPLYAKWEMSCSH